LRPLEVALVALAGFYPLAAFAAPRLRSVHWLPIAAALLVIVHLIVEGYRWQMVPVYVVVAIMARVGGRLLRKPAPGLQIGVSGRPKLGLLALIPVVLMALPPALVPVPSLPEPSGPYEIGTVSLYLVDEDRTEIYGLEPGGSRELMVQVWYPADPGPDTEPGSWTEDIDQIGPANAERLGFPPFVLDHLALAKTHSYPDAPLSLAGERYPVILSSHGWTGFRTVNVDQSEALASHGYIVVSIDHTYGSIMTVFPDGRAIAVDDAALPEEDDVGPQAYQAAAQTLVEVYAADLAFVLDSLETVNEEDDRFAGRLDLDRVGLFGHSTGGGAVVTTCHSDERCVAAAGLDAWVEPVARNIISDGLTQPFLSVRSEEWTSYDNDPLLVALSIHGDGGQYLASIAGTQHWDFVAIPLLTPLAPQLGLKGPINSEKVMAINADLLVSFFDAYLKGGQPFDVAGLSSRYPELNLEAVPR
jgi:predicted dienelactone hydrolase